MGAVKRCKVRLAVKTVEDIPQNEVPSQLTINLSYKKAQNAHIGFWFLFFVSLCFLVANKSSARGEDESFDRHKHQSD